MPDLRLARVILRVADLDRAVEFWVDRVGLSLADRSGHFAFLDAGGRQLVLNEMPEPRDDAGLTELVLEADDFTVAHAQMVARGVPFEVEPRTVMENEGHRLVAAHFRDPDGHLASLTGWQEA